MSLALLASFNMTNAFKFLWKLRRGCGMAKR